MEPLGGKGQVYNLPVQAVIMVSILSLTLRLETSSSLIDPGGGSDSVSLTLLLLDQDYCVLEVAFRATSALLKGQLDLGLVLMSARGMLVGQILSRVAVLVVGRVWPVRQIIWVLMSSRTMLVEQILSRVVVFVVGWVLPVRQIIWVLMSARVMLV